MPNPNVTTAFLAAAAATTNIPQNPGPIICTQINDGDHQQQDFEDFLILEASDAAADHEGMKENTAFSCLKTSSQKPFISSYENEIMMNNSVEGSSWELVPRSGCSDYYMQPNDDMEYIKTMERADMGFKIAFRTKSDIELMDDGYKWRKYGKKKVKNSPNPRHYYRCSTRECKVKKRVEREREDPRFVITTYQGKHTHESQSPASAHSTSQYTLQFLHQP